MGFALTWAVLEQYQCDAEDQFQASNFAEQSRLVASLGADNGDDASPWIVLGCGKDAFDVVLVEIDQQN